MFTVNRELLAKELAILQSAAERKTTIPVLAFILLQVADGIAKLTATDTDITITAQVEAEGEPYSGCIPAHQLSSLIKLLEGETVQFTERPNGRIEIKAGTSKHVLATLAADQFPAIESVGGTPVSIPAETLGTMLRRTVFCAGQEGEGKGYTFQCVNFEIADGILTIVATNSRQFGSATLPVESESALSILVAQRAVIALEKLCETGGAIQFSADANHAKFQLGERIIMVRLTVGQFPAWRLVVPERLDHHTVIDAERLAALVKRACITTKEAKLIRHPIHLLFSKTELQIATKSENGESIDLMPVSCKTLNGSNLDIQVNGEHLINLISRTEGNLTCGFSDDKRLIQLGVEGDDSYKYITMALR